MVNVEAPENSTSFQQEQVSIGEPHNYQDVTLDPMMAQQSFLPSI